MLSVQVGGYGTRGVQTVGDLAELVGKFRAETGYPGDKRARVDSERAALAAGLTPAALDAPDAGLLRRLAGKEYGRPGPQPGYYLLLQTDEGIARVAGMLRYLLYGPGRVEDRLDACLSGEHKLPKVGEAIMVKALAVTDPQRGFRATSRRANSASSPCSTRWARNGQRA